LTILLKNRAFYLQLFHNISILKLKKQMYHRTARRNTSKEIAGCDIM